jgi:rubrerythrin
MIVFIDTEVNPQTKRVADYGAVREDGAVFSREGDVIWQCSNCGHIVIGKKAPEICPVCDHPQSYFQIKAENY